MRCPAHKCLNIACLVCERRLIGRQLGNPSGSATEAHLALLQGIFATHLHSLLDMQLNAQHLVRMRMETAEDGRFIRATMRMLPGQCTE